MIAGITILARLVGFYTTQAGFYKSKMAEMREKKTERDFPKLM